MAESGRPAAERRERQQGRESGELPPERSNLGSQRSRERPETPGTTDCTASAAVSLACSSHRVRLLTSRAVTLHRVAPHRLSLGVPRSAAARHRQRRGDTACSGVRVRQHEPPAQPRRDLLPPPPGRPLAAGTGGSDAIAPSCTPGGQAPRWAGRGAGRQAGRQAGRAGHPHGHRSCTGPAGQGSPLPASPAAACSPETESLAPLLCRVSPLYLCLVIHL